MTTRATRIITTKAEIYALAPAWQDLWLRCPSATPFQSPAWQLAWWRQFGTDGPVIALVQDGTQIQGLLATYILDGPDGPKLLPIGAGISDTLDALVSPDAPPDTHESLLAACLSRAPGQADFVELPPNSSLRSVDVPCGWRADQHSGEPCPVVLLSSTLAGSVPAKAMRKLRMNRNRAARAGGTSVRLSTAKDASEMLDELFGLHSACWDERGQNGGVLADDRIRATLRDAVPALIADGAARIAALDIDGRCASACLSFLASDRVLLYLSGFDTEFAFYSPGSLLLGELFELAIEESYTEIHFLRGDETYKYAWGGIDRFNMTRSFVRD